MFLANWEYIVIIQLNKLTPINPAAATVAVLTPPLEITNIIPQNASPK